VEKLASFNVNATILMQARENIRAHYGRAPKTLDLFAGGGAIPLAAVTAFALLTFVEFSWAPSVSDAGLSFGLSPIVHTASAWDSREK
jgi:hypothetical protein